MNLSNIAILNIICFDYCCIISRISKNETINVMKNINFTEKAKHKHLLLHIKIGKEISTFGDIEIKKKNEIKVLFLKDVDLQKVLPSNKISFGEKKNINTLLITWITMIKLSHHI